MAAYQPLDNEFIVLKAIQFILAEASWLIVENTQRPKRMFSVNRYRAASIGANAGQIGD